MATSQAIFTIKVIKGMATALAWTGGTAGPRDEVTPEPPWFV